MKEKLNKYGLSVFKVTLTSVLCITGILSVIYVAATTNELFSYFYCIATLFFAALPMALSIIFRWKLNTFFYVLFSFYTYGPLLGAVYNFYYFTPNTISIKFYSSYFTNNLLSFRHIYSLWNM